MSAQWYCQLDDVTSGPFTLEELQFLAERGRLSPEDRVREGVNGQWIPADSLAGVFRVPQQPEIPASPQLVRRIRRRNLSSTIERKEPTDELEPTDPVIETLPEPNETTTPPLPRQESSKKAVLAGTGIGVLLALVLLLLLLLFWPNSDPMIAGGSGSSTGESTSQGTSNGNGVSSGGNDEGDSVASSQGNDEDASGSDGEEAATGAESEQEDSGGELPSEQPPSNEDSSAPSSNDEVPETSEETEEASPGDKPPEEPPPAPGEFSIERLPDSETAAPAGMFGGRKAGLRSRIALREGGSKESESAVERGLKWLAEHQDSDGRWTLHRFAQAGNCKGQCANPGTRSDVAGTALAILPFLGAGYTHKQGKYKRAVHRGLNWLVENQQPDGSFRDIGVGNMYAHGQATIVLCETLAMTKDKKLAKPAQRSIDYIIRAQHGAGGWRYTPEMPGDTSVLGWQVMALRSAQTAELNVPRKTLAGVRQYLDSAQADELGGLYAYMPVRGRRMQAGRGMASPAMTAEGLLCRQYTGWKRNHAGLKSGVEYLLQNLPDKNRPNIYYWYYATQVMHHMGGEAWNKWNDVMRKLLVDTQELKGHSAGSWNFTQGHDASGGRLYATALAICSLEVYYRHMPLYR